MRPYLTSQQEIHDKAAEQDASSQVSPAGKRKIDRTPTVKPAPKPKASSEINCGATTDAVVKKRRKKVDPNNAPKSRKKRRSTDEAEQISDAEAKKPFAEPREKSPHGNGQRSIKKTLKGSANQAKAAEATSSDLSESISNDAKDQSDEGAGQAAIESESEMSVVLDEVPKSKAKPKSSDSSKAKTSKPHKKGIKQPTDPDAEEIKRLQGWLIKCGIRKLWGKELASYPNSKTKIRHLKEMLAEVGMTGRYSVEKASGIREERELKSELEAVQAGEKQWGKGDSDVEANGKPRRLARGLRELDFLGDDGGEETD